MEMAFCVDSYESMAEVLTQAMLDRIIQEQIDQRQRKIRSPVCILFARKRAKPASELIDQIVTSFDYWYHSTGSTLDIILPGWDSTKYFDPGAYSGFETEIMQRTKWVSSGKLESLIVDLEFDIDKRTIEIDWKKSVYLPLEDMILQKRFSSIDEYIGQLLNAARATKDVGKTSSVWEISDQFTVHKGWKLFWEWLKSQKILGDAISVYDELRPYAVCDLSK